MANAYQSVASAASFTCSKPSGTASGDTLTAAVFSIGGTTPASLAGWTQRATTSFSSTYTLTILTKIAGGSEPANYTFAAGATVAGATVLIRSSGGDASVVIDGTPTTSTTATVGSITTTSANGILIMATVGIGDTTGTSIAPDAAMTERAEVVEANVAYGTLEVATQALGASGATGTRTATDASASAFLTAMLVIKEASSNITAVVPSPAASTWAMGAPTVTSVSSAVASTSTWAMPAPSAKADATAVAAASTWAMPVPTVIATSSVVEASMTWSMEVPTVLITAGATIPSDMPSVWSMNAPSGLVIAPAAAAASTWDMGVPTVQMDYGVSIPSPAVSLWAMDAPSATSTASAAVSASQWAMPAPSVVVVSQTAAATSTWDMGIPDIGVRATAVAATSTWAMNAPGISYGQMVPEGTSVWSMGVPTVEMTISVPSMEMVWGMAVQNAGQTWPSSPIKGARGGARYARGITGKASTNESGIRAHVTGSRSIRGEVHDE